MTTATTRVARRAGGRTPHEQQGGQIGRERRDEQREEHDAEPAAVGATRVCRDDRSALDPGTGDTARHEERDHAGHDERDPARPAIEPLGYSASGGTVVDGGGDGGGVAGGRDAGGARGVDSFFFSFFAGGGSAGVVSSAVVVSSSSVVAGAT